MTYASPAQTDVSHAAIVLAAGRSSRTAPRHKLLEQDADGRAMVARVVDAVLASRAHPVLVVTGHRAAEVQAALDGRPVQFVDAPDFADGLSASLRAGLAAVPPWCAAALVVLGDMPLVTAATIDQILAYYSPGCIVVPSHNGQFGNPVLWDRCFFAAMMALAGDAGARSLLHAHAAVVTVVPTGDAVLRDFDTVHSLAALHG